MYRWKLAIQEYDFDIEYIKGADNVVADGMSRFCPVNVAEDDEDVELVCMLGKFDIPDDKRKLLGQVHNSQVGHHGVDRTFSKLTQAGHNWQFMREHVRRFIRNCPCCQKMSQIKVPIVTHPFVTSTYIPFERINVDSIGPLPKDDYGNEYVIVIRDTFTRMVGLYTAPSTEAKPAARALLQYVGLFGCPSQILSDNGSQYVNELITELIKMMGSEHMLTLRYSKEENAIVERANKEVLRHLRNLLFDREIKQIWSDVLPLVQRIMNAEPIEHLGASPAQLVFGNSVNLDRSAPT